MNFYIDSISSMTINSAKKIRSNLDLVPLVSLTHNSRSDIIEYNMKNIISKMIYDGIEPISTLKKYCNLLDKDQGYKPNIQIGYNCRRYSTVFHNYRDGIYHTQTYKIFFTADGMLQANKSFGIIKQGIGYKDLFYLCVKKEYVEYFFQCIFLKQDVDFRIFTLVINEEFDRKDTYAPRVRPAFRKYIRKYYMDLGVDIIYKSGDLDDYFYTTFKLEALTPMELKQIKKDLVQELLTI